MTSWQPDNLTIDTRVVSVTYTSQGIKKIYIKKHFTRAIFNRCNIPFNSYSNRLYQLNIRSLQYRRIYFDLITIFKIMHGISGLNFDYFFVCWSQPHILCGNGFKIDILNKYKPSTCHNSFFVRAVKLWNALPNDISSILYQQSLILNWTTLIWAESPT